MLNIIKSEDSSVVIGMHLLKEFVVHRNLAEGTLVLHSSISSDFLSVENLVFIVILVPLLISWRITDLNQPPALVKDDDEEDIRNTTLNLILEATGVFLSLATYVFPSSLQIVKDYVIVYVFTGIVFGISFILKFLSIILEFPANNGERNTGKSILHYKSFETRLIRSFSQEVLLLTAIWLLLAQRRIEALSTILVLGVSVYLIYVSSFYCFLMSIYILVNWQKSRPASNFFSWVSFFTFLLVGFQGLVTVNFFFPPFLVQNNSIYTQLLIPALLFLYLFIICAAIYVMRLYLNKWNMVLLYKLKSKDQTKANSTSSLKKRTKIVFK